MDNNGAKLRTYLISTTRKYLNSEHTIFDPKHPVNLFHVTAIDTRDLSEINIKLFHLFSF